MTDSLTVQRGGVGMPRIEGGSERGPRRRGFTLIEIMIVVAIVGIFMVVGLPSFTRAFQKEGMRKAVSDMLEACAHARAQAVLTGVPTELVVRFEEFGWTLSVVQAPQAATAGHQPAPSDAERPRRQRFTPFHATLPENVTFELLDVNFQDKLEEGEARVRFYPTATSDEFAAVLLSTDQERRLISLEVVTALAELETNPQRFLLRHR